MSTTQKPKKKAGSAAQPSSNSRASRQPAKKKIDPETKFKEAVLKEIDMISARLLKLRTKLDGK